MRISASRSCPTAVFDTCGTYCSACIPPVANLAAELAEADEHVSTLLRMCWNLWALVRALPPELSSATALPRDHTVPSAVPSDRRINGISWWGAHKTPGDFCLTRQVTDAMLQAVCQGFLVLWMR